MNKISVRKDMIKSVSIQFDYWSQELQDNQSDSVKNIGVWLDRIKNDIDALLKYWPENFGMVLDRDSVDLIEKKRIEEEMKKNG